ncbi:MAG TPA: hypothetical protein ENK35_04415 [Candidatus Tenderia sp.]|nr:hypothetical protein [Candidatus Tenderia sp.]
MKKYLTIAAVVATLFIMWWLYDTGREAGYAEAEASYLAAMAEADAAHKEAMRSLKESSRQALAAAERARREERAEYQRRIAVALNSEEVRKWHEGIVPDAVVDAVWVQ